MLKAGVITLFGGVAAAIVIAAMFSAPSVERPAEEWDPHHYLREQRPFLTKEQRAAQMTRFVEQSLLTGAPRPER